MIKRYVIRSPIHTLQYRSTHEKLVCSLNMRYLAKCSAIHLTHILDKFHANGLFTSVSGYEAKDEKHRARIRSSPNTYLKSIMFDYALYEQRKDLESWTEILTAGFPYIKVQE